MNINGQESIPNSESKNRAAVTKAARRAEFLGKTLHRLILLPVIGLSAMKLGYINEGEFLSFSAETWCVASMLLLGITGGLLKGYAGVLNTFQPKN